MADYFHAFLLSSPFQSFWLEVMSRRSQILVVSILLTWKNRTKLSITHWLDLLMEHYTLRKTHSNLVGQNHTFQTSGPHSFSTSGADSSIAPITSFQLKCVVLAYILFITQYSCNSIFYNTVICHFAGLLLL